MRDRIKASGNGNSICSSVKMHRAAATVFTAMLIAFLAAFFLPFGTSLAAEDKEPVVPANRDSSRGRTSFITATDTGYTLGYVEGDKLFVVEMNSSFAVTAEKSIDLELPKWGGFYAAEDAYYVAVGKRGVAYEDVAVRVIKYDKNWNRLGAADFPWNDSFYVSYPFDKSDAKMTERNGKLYLTAGYSGYGYGEGSFTIEIDEEEMTGRTIFITPVDSFSSSPYVAFTGESLFLLEQNGNDRRTQITAYDGENKEVVPVLNYGGVNNSTYYVRKCYASVDGMEISGTNILTVGTSIDQSLYDEVDESTAHNIYLTVTPNGDFSEEATSFTWLTDHEGDGAAFNGLEMLRITDDRFLIMWQEFEDENDRNLGPDSKGKYLYYCYVDGHGNLIGEKKAVKAALSNCRPVLSGSEVIWYASNGNKVTFYRFDTENADLTKTEFHSAGEGITWTLEDGTLTFSGEGVISAGDFYYVMPLSSYYSYSTGGSLPIWMDVDEPVKKIVISEGITGIADQEFKDIGTLEELEIPSTMKSIGEWAFVWCDHLRSVLFKSMDCSFGADAFWSGWYTYSDRKVYYVTFACQKGSTAEAYAEENYAGCRHILLNEDLSLFTGAIKQDGVWCVFGEDGMQLENAWGLTEVAGKTYCFDDDGNVLVGWQKVYGNTYHFSETTAAMDTGLTKVGKKYYFFEDDGSMAVRWKKVGTDYYYFGSDGVMQTGWIRIVGRYFYLKKNGKMHTGWYTENGKTYYMNEDGVMLTGTVVVDGETCIFANSGALILRSSEPVKNGWKQMGNEWAFFRDGSRLTGWQKIGGKYYYFELDGIMRTGWRYLKYKWYYLDPASGAMKTGWQKIDGKWYFFDPSGYMVTGTRTIKGKKYNFDAKGVCLNP